MLRAHQLHPCPRCRTVFKKKEEVYQHLRETDVCAIREQSVDEIRDWDAGFDDQQLKEIQRRRRKRQHDDQEVSDEEKWKLWYKILFPEEQEIPSPCKATHLPLPQVMNGKQQLNQSDCDINPFPFPQNLGSFITDLRERLGLSIDNNQQIEEVSLAVIDVIRRHAGHHNDSRTNMSPETSLGVDADPDAGLDVLSQSEPQPGLPSATNRMAINDNFDESFLAFSSIPSLDTRGRPVSNGNASPEDLGYYTSERPVSLSRIRSRYPNQEENDPSMNFTDFDIGLGLSQTLVEDQGPEISDEMSRYVNYADLPTRRSN